MANQPVKIIFGTGGFGRQGKDVSTQFLEILEKHHVKDLDTASLYPKSEKVLGELDAPKKFIIHTKAPGFSGGSQTKKSIEVASEKSFRELGVDSVETYFLHSPDTDTPLEETLEAINDLYKAGRFKHFGLSNFSAGGVEKVHHLCTQHSWVPPTVYQGNYNPVSRHIEHDLFPVLRKLNIAFYAYSPLAGGFLVKDATIFSDDHDDKSSARWAKSSPLSGLYRNLYGKPTLIAALKDWEAIATDYDIAKSALAYRWVVFHSALKGDRGDGCIIGASRSAQLIQTLGDLEAGPLPEGAVKRIDEVWESVKDEAPVDNYHSNVKSKLA